MRARLRPDCSFHRQQSGQTTTEYLMATGLCATIFVTVMALMYWPAVKSSAEPQLGRCVPAAVRGDLAVSGCPAGAATPTAGASPGGGYSAGTGTSTSLPASPPPPVALPPPPTSAPPRPVGPQGCRLSSPTVGSCWIEGAVDPGGQPVTWSFGTNSTCPLGEFSIRTLPGGRAEWSGPSSQGGERCTLVLKVCNSDGACSTIPMAWTL